MDKALLPRKNVPVTNTRKIKRGLTFSNTTRVRNQYESVDPITGEFKVNRNNYKVNATNDDKMPGYTMNSRKFRPHSKSALQFSAAEMKRLKQEKEFNLLTGTVGNMNNLSVANLNTGWGPAVSSVGNSKYTPTNMPAAYRNRNAMRSYFGNAWINANVKREEAENLKKLLMDQAKELYKQRGQALEKAFFQKTGIKAPPVIERELGLHLHQIQYTSGLSGEELVRKRQALIAKAQATLDSIPFEDVKEFEKQMTITRNAWKAQVAEAERKAAALYASAKIGKQYAPLGRRTLSNRLRNAKAIGKAAAPNFE